MITLARVFAVRRADAQSQIEIQIVTPDLSAVVIVTPDQLRNLILDGLPMVIGGGRGTITSPSIESKNGKPLDGRLVTYRTITVNSRSSGNGQARATR